MPLGVAPQTNKEINIIIIIKTRRKRLGTFQRPFQLQRGATPAAGRGLEAWDFSGDRDKGTFPPPDRKEEGPGASGQEKLLKLHSQSCSKPVTTGGGTDRVMWEHGVQCRPVARQSPSCLQVPLHRG